MSEQVAGFHFSCNADASANDYTIYVQERGRTPDVVTMAIRYKNSEPNVLYQIEMDSDDLIAFGRMCLDHAAQMKERQQT